MKLDNYSHYYIDTLDFNNLFNDDIKPESLNLLKTSAAGGDVNAIELLTNLALRQDALGCQAEEILFSLFIGETDADSHVSQHIQEMAFTLYQLSAESSMKNNTDMYKMRTPSRLLYMAGSASNISEKHSLSRLFTQNQHPHSQYEQFDDHDIWNPARMLTTDEINTAMKLCARYYNAREINFPIGLLHPSTHENILAQQISEQIDNTDFLHHPEFFPVNTGEHWIVFGLYKTAPNAQPQAMVFSTANELSQEVKNNIIAAAQIGGVTDPDNHITFLEDNIQQHVPNGCGLFTIEAIKLLMENNFQSPIEILKNFMSSFTQNSAEKQALYNIQNRYQIYADTYIR